MFDAVRAVATRRPDITRHKRGAAGDGFLVGGGLLSSVTGSPASSVPMILSTFSRMASALLSQRRLGRCSTRPTVCAREVVAVFIDPEGLVPSCQVASGGFADESLNVVGPVGVTVAVTTPPSRADPVGGFPAMGRRQRCGDRQATFGDDTVDVDGDDPSTGI